MVTPKKIFILLCSLICFIKASAQLPLDTAAYNHTIIVVQNKHYITSWGQFGNFDTSIVQAGTNLGGAYIKKQGTAQQHKVLINEGGMFTMNGVEIDDCAYLDFIGLGSADAYGIKMNAQNNGVGIPINGKCHDLQFIGINIDGGFSQGITAKIEANDFASKYLCDTSYAYFVQRRIRISNCKVRNNGNESVYVNSTGWFSRDRVTGNAPFLGCPLGNTNVFDGQNRADTITNSGTVTNKAYLDPAIADPAKITVWSGVIARISGTISGNIVLSGSNNGTTYTQLQTQPLTNVASNTYTFNLSTRSNNYFKIDVVTSGTMSATLKSYVSFNYFPPVSDSIFIDSNVFINPRRSAVNFSNMSHGFYRGNKGWHLGGELNGAQGKMLAAGGKLGYLGDTTYVSGNKCFGSWNNNFWFVAEGYIVFENNYGDSSGYWGTTKNPDPTPSTVFGVSVGRTVPTTWRICNNAFYFNTASPSTQYSLNPGAQNTTANVVGGNTGNVDIKGTLVYSNNCGAVANQPPIVNAGNNATITLPTNSYQLQGSGSDPDGTIVTVVWTQVSGGSYTIDNANIFTPTVSNLTAGTYVFKLTVTDNIGASASKNVTITVLPAPNQQPNVSAGGTVVITLPTNSYAFTSATASDPDGSIVSYLWTQVSGSSYTIDNAAILHATVSNLLVGTYVFKLTVTDNGGLSNSDNITITVNAAPNQPPVVNAGNNVTITLPTNLYTIADATASDPDGTIVSYVWSKTAGGTYTINDATILNPTVSNLVAGVYTFKLVVTDNNGATATSNMKITVNNQPNIPPNVNAGKDTTLILPTTSYQTVATATDADGTVTTYQWLQISGTTVTISNASSLLPLISNFVVGTFGFSLTVGDNLGATAKDTIFITVNPAANKTPSVNAGGTAVITLPVNSYQVTANASDTDGTIIAYAWTQVSGGAYTISNASVLNPLFTNLLQGTYVFKLTVTDNVGASNSDNLTIIVNHALNIPPSANAGSDRTITLPTNSVQISGTSATDPDGNVVSVAWTQASGGSYTINDATILNPLFSNLTQGTYRFALTATDDSAQVGRDTMNIIVNHALNLPPVVSAGNDTAITQPATTINLIGTATDPDGNIVSSLWENTDGCVINTASSLITTATCATTGTHLFTLTATDDSSISSIDFKIAIVNPAANVPPVAIASNDTTIYLPLDSVILTQSGTDADGTIVGYLTTIYQSKYAPVVARETTTSPAIKGLQAGDTIRVLLRVQDDDGIFAYDTTNIYVLADTVNHPPVIVIDSNINVRMPVQFLSIDASQSYDPDPGDVIVSYRWVQTEGDTSIDISGENGSIMTLSNLPQGFYTWILTVTDNRGADSQATVNVVVLASVRVKAIKAKKRS